jgi:hypothetical protein
MRLPPDFELISQCHSVLLSVTLCKLLKQLHRNPQRSTEVHRVLICENLRDQRENAINQKCLVDLRFRLYPEIAESNA